MFDPTQSIIKPPRPRNGEGAGRRVGIEIEFAGISAGDTAQAIASHFGGAVSELNRHRYMVIDTALGDFKSELDTRYAHPEGILPSPSDQTAEWIHRLGEIVSGTIGDAGAIVIPCEVVTPPIEIDSLTLVDQFLLAIRQVGAKGTDHSVFYAFGLHLNPEVATEDPAWLISVIKSQILLSDWLRSVMSIDTSRYLTGFASPFPKSYADLVLQPDYQPDQTRLITDYIAHNPTRDRELVMLPLFATLDRDLVMSSLPGVKINPRPTFHYRLPNAALERPAWSIVLEWNRWCLVERLADDEATQAALAAAYRQNQSSKQEVSWALRTSEWLAHGLNQSSMC